MSEVIQYVPVIKAKKNDLAALCDVRAEKRTAIRPLIELAEYGNVDVDAILAQYAHRLAEFQWPNAPYADLYSLQPDATDSSGENGIVSGFRLLEASNAKFIVTYGLSRNETLWPKLGAVARRTGGFFCFRVDIDDLDDQAEDTWVEIVERAAQMKIEPSRVDVIVDLRYVGDQKPVRVVELVVDFLARKPTSFSMRNLALVGSSALQNVGSVPRNGEADISRRELYTWAHLLHELAGTKLVAFGDYGVIHPDFSQSAPSPNANGKIRYTRGSSIHYFRGSCLRKPPKYAQYYDLADRVVKSPLYAGRGFSAGDERIWQCANHLCGSGNLSTWVRADQNHHFEITVEQVIQLQRKIVNASALDLTALVKGI